MKFDLIAHLKEKFAWLQQLIMDNIGWLFGRPLN